MTETNRKRKVTIGDTVDLDGATMVKLPDGVVVTARGSYTVQHEGAHKIIGGPSFDGVKG